MDDAWTNPLIWGHLFLTDTASDQVLCTIQFSHVLVSALLWAVIHLGALTNLSWKLLTDGTFEDCYSYNLIIYVETPESSGVDTSYLSSPLATLGRYEGLATNFDAPEWTCMEARRPPTFRQPQGAMAEVFTEIAFWTKNLEIVSILPSIVIRSKLTPTHWITNSAESDAWVGYGQCGWHCRTFLNQDANHARIHTFLCEADPGKAKREKEWKRQLCGGNTNLSGHQVHGCNQAFHHDFLIFLV